MKVEELRVGNYVNNGDGDVYKIDVSYLADNTIDGRYFGEPIPLTEEWLLRFGFEYDSDTNSWSILTSLEKFDYCFEISNKYQKHFQPDFMSVDIKYVHSLQNLFFALTGTELILKDE